ncbi:CYTH domain-containing protein [Mucilaginibacter sp.]|jgi:adenylate cyclase|uniref:CYTH domain-containing protein n=1 Tax=Mucilaginibacter sp. TaxID=1882438 RepID=UPI003566A09C
MGIEIERKFLVDHEKWQQLIKPQGKAYKQGYLLNDEKRTVRVRVADDVAYITLKGSTTGISRSEFEYTIPVNEGEEILKNMATSFIEKMRYNIDYAGNVWEVDVFTGDNQGLIVAEIELKHENQEFEKPEWVKNEVSDDHRYLNACLSVNPFKNWA